MHRTVHVLAQNGGKQMATRPSVDPVQRARTKLGYKNKWHRYNVDLSNQIRWQQPLQDEPVGIIGGGISGLACAQGLAKHGMKAVVFDTGEHSVGGRAATRTTQDNSLHQEWIHPDHPGLKQANLIFDHAAQCFTATDPGFKQQVDAWEAAGVVQRWQGAVGTLKAGGVFDRLSAEMPLYVAKGGMRNLAQRMAEQVQVDSCGGVDIKQPIWISRMTASQAAGGWQLTANRQGHGPFGAIVIAHNGKCANRLVGPSGAPHVASQLMQLRLSAVWALMVVFEGPVTVPHNMEGAFVQGSNTLSWVANNTAKLGVKHPEPYTDIQCWTLISTNSYGQSNKVPQEKVPADVAVKVAGDLLQEFTHLLGTNLPEVIFTRCQLWGAALPTNTPNIPCILDAEARVGVCGDWLTGASIQSAVLSGWDLADRLAGLRSPEAGLNPGGVADLSVGLDVLFQPLKEAEIGEFPGLPKEVLGGGVEGMTTSDTVSAGGVGVTERQRSVQQRKLNRPQRKGSNGSTATSGPQQQLAGAGGAAQGAPRPQSVVGQQK